MDVVDADEDENRIDDLDSKTPRFSYFEQER